MTKKKNEKLKKEVNVKQMRTEELVKNLREHLKWSRGEGKYGWSDANIPPLSPPFDARHKNNMAEEILNRVASFIGMDKTE